VPGAVHQEYSTQIANQIAKILDNIPRIDPESLSDDPNGPGIVLYSHEAGNIVISQSADGAWRFSIATVKVVPEIYHGLEVSGYFDQRMMNGEARFELSGGKDVNKFGLLGYIPPSWRHKTFLLEDWQWLFLILVVLVGLIVYKLVPLLVGQSLKIWFKRSILWDKTKLIPGISRPFGFLAMSGFWWLSLGNSGLELNTLNVLLTAVKFMTAVGIVWCAIRAVDVVSEYVEKKAQSKESRINDLLAPFARKSFKVLVTILGIIFFASNFNINVTSLVAGLGLGGLAIALAAQDTLSNFFGSITVLLDRPFHVGDWVVIGGEIEGTVEELGFRSTRIRTFYNSVIIVPNSKLISTHVDNMGERQYRRIREKISIDFETPPDKIEAFCEGIRELIRNHPYTRKDNYNVWLDEFSGGSFNILLNCFLIAPDWSTEAREKHRLLLDIIRLAYELGIQFGLPSQAIYMAKEQPLPAIFPEKGSIKKHADSEMIYADKKAREIATSGLGGEGVKPPPFDFKNPTEFISSEDEQEL
jgi:MscS family membrane protein